MKILEKIKIYCKHCKKHHIHKLKLFKAAPMRDTAEGQRKNIAKHKKGYGGKTKFVKMNKKQTKKPTFIAECSECKKKQYYVIPKRMKKIEIIKK